MTDLQQYAVSAATYRLQYLWHDEQSLTHLVDEAFALDDGVSVQLVTLGGMSDAAHNFILKLGKDWKKELLAKSSDVVVLESKIQRKGDMWRVAMTVKLKESSIGHYRR